MRFRRPPKVEARAAFHTPDGTFRCLGGYSSLPTFRVNLNGTWVECRLVEYSEKWGWVAEEAGTVRGQLDPAVKVELRRPESK
jgi:hypothetical protein